MSDEERYFEEWNRNFDELEERVRHLEKKFGPFTQEIRSSLKRWKKLDDMKGAEDIANKVGHAILLEMYHSLILGNFRYKSLRAKLSYLIQNHPFEKREVFSLDDDSLRQLDEEGMERVREVLRSMLPKFPMPEENFQEFRRKIDLTYTLQLEKMRERHEQEKQELIRRQQRRGQEEVDIDKRIRLMDHAKCQTEEQRQSMRKLLDRIEQDREESWPDTYEMPPKPGEAGYKYYQAGRQHMKEIIQREYEKQGMKWEDPEEQEDRDDGKRS